MNPAATESTADRPMRRRYGFEYGSCFTAKEVALSSFGGAQAAPGAGGAVAGGAPCTAWMPALNRHVRATVCCADAASPFTAARAAARHAALKRALHDAVAQAKQQAAAASSSAAASAASLSSAAAAAAHKELSALRAGRKARRHLAQPLGSVTVAVDKSERGEGGSGAELQQVQRTASAASAASAASTASIAKRRKAQKSTASTASRAKSRKAWQAHTNTRSGTRQLKQTNTASRTHNCKTAAHNGYLHESCLVRAGGGLKPWDCCRLFLRRQVPLAYLRRRGLLEEDGFRGELISIAEGEAGEGSDDEERVHARASFVAPPVGAPSQPVGMIAAPPHGGSGGGDVAARDASSLALASGAAGSARGAAASSTGGGGSGGGEDNDEEEAEEDPVAEVCKADVLKAMVGAGGGGARYGELAAALGVATKADREMLFSTLEKLEAQQLAR